MAHYIHISYPRQQLHGMVEALKAQFADSDEVSVVDYGISTKQVQGYIVLAWQQEVNEDFIAQLEQDSTVLDLSIFTGPCSTDDLFSSLEYV